MKPSKPFEAFPLFAHASGKWAKKINGKTVYFGTWDDPEAALSAYEASLALESAPYPKLSGSSVRAVSSWIKRNSSTSPANSLIRLYETTGPHVGDWSSSLELGHRLRSSSRLTGTSTVSIALKYVTSCRLVTKLVA